MAVLLSDRREYHLWNAMMNRCNSNNNNAFIHYGGRGIKVCERWHSFHNFIEDMGIPTPEQSLERKDVNKGYNPSNCLWILLKRQARNRRDSKYLTHNGETKLLVEWAELLGIKRSTLAQRIYVYGWSVERSLTKKSPNKAGG